MSLPLIEMDLVDLDATQPGVRAGDWRCALVARLLGDCMAGGEPPYRDASERMWDHFRSHSHPRADEHGECNLSWNGLHAEYDRFVATYQEYRVTEYAAQAVACILLNYRAHLSITEVTRWGERADFWLGDREFLLEVSGIKSGEINSRYKSKVSQLAMNPFGKDGYVCIAEFSQRQARLWFCCHSSKA